MLSREEVEALYAQGPEAVYAVLELLGQRVKQLEAEVKELQRRVNQDSHNSHKPPSSDGLKKKNQSQREKGKRPSGGQKGHPGHRLALVEEPDEIIVHQPSCCQGCGQGLTEVSGVWLERRQVVELPVMSAAVTEHRRMVKSCPSCQQENVGTFPAEVNQMVQYGPRLQAALTYLHVAQLLPYERACEVLTDLCGLTVSEGTLDNSLQRCAERLEPIEAAIADALVTAEVLHQDETGMRVKGKTGWLHTTSTTTLTYYCYHPKRGRAALQEIGILPQFSGVTVHDSYASYLTYACQHALCHAHLQRELIALAESGETWAAELKQLFLDIKKRVDACRLAGLTALPMDVYQDFQTRFNHWLAQGQACHPPPQPTPGKRGRTKQTPARNLLDRLQTHSDAVLRFMNDFKVPFDNNLAERDLRMMKVKQKVSGCFRSEQGARLFCRIRGYLSTLRKQSLPILPALVSLFQGSPLLPSLAA
jgi:transposase